MKWAFKVYLVISGKKWKGEKEREVTKKKREGKTKPRALVIVTELVMEPRGKVGSVKVSSPSIT